MIKRLRDYQDTRQKLKADRLEAKYFQQKKKDYLQFIRKWIWFCLVVGELAVLLVFCIWADFQADELTHILNTQWPWFIPTPIFMWIFHYYSEEFVNWYIKDKN